MIDYTTDLPAFPGEAAAAAAARGRAHAAWARAADPSATVEELTELADTGDTLARSSVARNPSTPPDVLDRLADDPDFLVRTGVAGNETATPATLLRLALSSPLLAVWVADNPSAPDDARIIAALTRPRPLPNTPGLS